MATITIGHGATYFYGPESQGESITGKIFSDGPVPVLPSAAKNNKCKPPYQYLTPAFFRQLGQYMGGQHPAELGDIYKYCKQIEYEHISHQDTSPRTSSNNNEIICLLVSIAYVVEATLSQDIKAIPTRRFCDETALAMAAGALKYGPWNFEKGHVLIELTAAICRHAKAVEDGEEMDQNTTEILQKEYGPDAPSVSHLGCIGANVNMALHQLELGTSR